MPNDRPPPLPFVDRTLDYTFPRDGDSYRILWDEDGLFPVDLDAMPVALGQKRQFFIDDYLIAAAHNIGYTVHQPRKHVENPIMRPETPWELGHFGINGGTVMLDDGLFRMWYRGSIGASTSSSPRPTTR